MKILMINVVCGIRSTGRICTDIADVLQLKGDECKVVYGRYEAPERYADISIRAGSELSVKIDALQTRLFDNAGFNSKAATRKLIAEIGEYAPDIIHLHNLHGYYVNIDILFKYLKKIDKPVIWTLHDCWAFTGHCSHFSLIGCEKWKSGCFDCPQKKKYPSSFFIDNSKKNYEKKKALFTSLSNLTLVTPSEWLAGLVRQSFLGKYEVLAIPNGVDLDAFKPTESDFRKKYGLEDKKIVLGVASSWGKSKGLYDFAKLSEILPNEYQIVLVGISKEEAHAYELPEKILCVDRTNSIEELSGIYTSANVFVNPSRQETMGLTTVEAMACGTPVITSSYTAVPEVVTTDGGVVLDDVSPIKIFEAIEKVLSCDYPNTRQNASKYEKKQQYLKYIELYREKTKI